MTYNGEYFDQVIDRRGTIAGKWDGLEFLYGNSDLIPMRVADTDFRPPREVVGAVIERAKHGIFGYGFYGFPYKDAVIDWHQRRNQITYQKDSVFFTPNVLVSLNNVVRALTEEGDQVLLFNPTYGPLEKEPLFAKREIVRAKLLKEAGYYEIDFNALTQLIEDHQIKLFILCNPHNPTGRVWAEEELIQLVTLCQANNIPIVSDEIHSDLIMPEQHFTPLMKVARALDYDQVVMLSAPTKTFNLAGLQASYYITDNQDFVKKIDQIKAYSHTGDLLNSFAYLALSKAYEYGADYVDSLNEYLFSNYEYLVEELKPFSFVEVTKLEATYLVWIELLSINLTGKELRTKMVESGVAIQSGDDFFEEDGLFFRVNIGCPRETLKAGLKAIVACLSELAKAEGIE